MHLIELHAKLVLASPQKLGKIDSLDITVKDHNLVMPHCVQLYSMLLLLEFTFRLIELAI